MGVFPLFASAFAAWSSVWVEIALVGCVIFSLAYGAVLAASKDTDVVFLKRSALMGQMTYSVAVGASFGNSCVDGVVLRAETTSYPSVSVLSVDSHLGRYIV